jgi:hypothetical protein
MELENIILSEVSKGLKAIGCMFSLICEIYVCKQCYEKEVTLMGGHTNGRSHMREGNKIRKLRGNMVDILSVQE